VNIDQLAPDEPLSPELVLVLPPEVRAQVLAALPAPVRPAPRLRVVAVPPAATPEPDTWPFGRMLVSRVMQLALIFVVITILTLAMSVVAHAVR
jgi:hypothetical protein